MFVIGVLGSRGKSRVLETVEAELKKKNKEVVCIGTHDNSAESFEKLLFKEVDYVLISISREDLIEGRVSKIKFDALVNLGFDSVDNIIDKIQDVVNNIKEKGYYIFNFDAADCVNLNNLNVYAISFGLNDKSTVTATSIDDLTCLCFSFCLQRAVVNSKGLVVQPFERPYELCGKYYDIYSYLAAYTCLLVIGII
ncbi:Mur ligase middle domain-containing protein [Caloramator fervidus]|uniref:Mur ligase middle domain-containing protein n=1 Tax=Caloramator fervidus TaxID=29344 RepID=A0A1H5UAS5_9CLOT|nr:Mur ligase family protein [Caloramator fervidus]SEF71421.1 Mur ligase middle domain-containing protein [Caloramator fervidus]